MLRMVLRLKDVFFFECFFIVAIIFIILTLLTFLSYTIDIVKKTTT